jgi:hypothetical protein
LYQAGVIDNFIMKSKGYKYLSVYSLSTQEPYQIVLSSGRTWLVLISDTCFDKLQEAQIILDDQCIGIYIGNNVSFAKEIKKKEGLKVYWSGDGEISSYFRETLEVEECPWYVCFYNGTMIYSSCTLPESLVTYKRSSQSRAQAVSAPGPPINLQSKCNEPAPEDDTDSANPKNREKKLISRGELQTLSRQLSTIDQFLTSNRNEIRNTSTFNLADLSKSLKKGEETVLKVPMSERKPVLSEESSEEEIEGYSVRIAEIVPPKTGVKPNPLTRRQFVDINEMISRSQRTLDRIPSRPKSRNCVLNGGSLGPSLSSGARGRPHLLN